MLIEWEGIFVWLIKGVLDYLNGGFCVFVCVMVVMVEYWEENDLIGVFLCNGCYIIGKDED